MTRQVPNPWEMGRSANNEKFWLPSPPLPGPTRFYPVHANPAGGPRIPLPSMPPPTTEPTLANPIGGSDSTIRPMTPPPVTNVKENMNADPAPSSRPAKEVDPFHHVVSLEDHLLGRLHHAQARIEEHRENGEFAYNIKIRKAKALAAATAEASEEKWAQQTAEYDVEDILREIERVKKQRAEDPVNSLTNDEALFLGEREAMRAQRWIDGDDAFSNNGSFRNVGRSNIFDLGSPPLGRPLTGSSHRRRRAASPDSAFDDRHDLNAAPKILPGRKQDHRRRRKVSRSLLPDDEILDFMPVPAPPPPSRRGRGLEPASRCRSMSLSSMSSNSSTPGPYRGHGSWSRSSSPNPRYIGRNKRKGIQSRSPSPFGRRAELSRNSEHGGHRQNRFRPTSPGPRPTQIFEVPSRKRTHREFSDDEDDLPSRQVHFKGDRGVCM